jgi:hypothetical protein
MKARIRTRPLCGAAAFALTIGVVFSRAGFAQARVSSEPPEPSLLNLTRQWSRASILGDLRELKTASNYLELRVWAGYGLTMTTQAVVIRREASHWSAFLARVLRCEMKIPRSVGDTASRATMQQYVAEARRHCGESVKDVGAGMQILATDSLLVDRLSLPDSLIESSWNAALRAGVADLPTRVKRNWVMDDGLTYVVELRRGNDYRASSIEHVERPESDADRKVQAVFSILSQLLSPEQRLKPGRFPGEAVPLFSVL